MKDCMKNGNSFSFLSHDINELEHSYQLNLPRVTVIMPLKGFGEHNLHNWRSQVISYMTCPWNLFEVSNILVSVQCLFGSFTSNSNTLEIGKLKYDLILYDLCISHTFSCIFLNL